MKMLSFIILVSVFTSCGQVDRDLVNESRRISEAASSSDQVQSGIEILCPAVYQPVCGQPPMPLCPEGYSCIQMMPQPRTYSNQCELSRAGASFISDGVCP